jgi:uncharacterized Fe-S cluster protein YjdI/CDGSH-type Zn-finger protein
MDRSVDDTFPLPGAKAYHSAQLTVTFDAARCLHATECIRGLPQVFDPAARPWVRPDAAATDAVIEVVRRCPTGALQVARRDETTGFEPPATPTTVFRSPAGRLYVRGELVVRSGDTARRETRIILCGCGNSAHQPHCDGSGPCHDEPVHDPTIDNHRVRDPAEAHDIRP